MSPSDQTPLLCTNDDGIHAPGLTMLVEVAAQLGETSVVAPDRQQSATSHALTLDRPLRITEVAERRWAVDGTPTDCVLLAIKELLDPRPAFVLSGVNHGPNMGEDVLYSGTVAAAMEATVIGIPAVALSYTGDRPEEIEGWQGVVRALLEKLLARDAFPDHTLFNVNLPAVAPDEVRGVRVTSLGRRRYAESITRANDPSGKEYFWIGGGSVHWEPVEGSDFKAVHEGYVSVTPLHLDLTNYELLEEIRGWDLGL